MSNITIKQISRDTDGWIFKVSVGGDGDETMHEVTLDVEYYKKLTQGKITPEELVRSSFEFLLARESKESILRQFNLRDISRYFPEYENHIITSQHS